MFEYYCVACKQLRLYAREGAPEQCGNCQSPRIFVDKIGSNRLQKVRFGTNEPDAQFSAVIVEEVMFTHVSRYNKVREKSPDEKIEVIVAKAIGIDCPICGAVSKEPCKPLPPVQAAGKVSF